MANLTISSTLSSNLVDTTSDREYIRIGHFWLTIIYSFLNFAHLIADLSVMPIAWYQIVLMTILVLIGILLNLVSYRWMTRWQLDLISSQFPWI